MTPQNYAEFHECTKCCRKLCVTKVTGPLENIPLLSKMLLTALFTPQRYRYGWVNLQGMIASKKAERRAASDASYMLIWIANGVRQHAGLWNPSSTLWHLNSHTNTDMYTSGKALCIYSEKKRSHRKSLSLIHVFEVSELQITKKKSDEQTC